MLCLDLCSGLGGFSEPFLDSPDWTVIRIDNDPRFQDVPCTTIGDVRDLGFVKTVVGDREATLILASPPCERFSLGNRMFPKKGVRQALDLVGACFEIIAELRPRYWIVENPKGRLRWFLGKPTSTIRLSDYGSKYAKPTDLWHNLQFPMIEKQMPFEMSRTSTQNKMLGSTGLLRLRDPTKRAKLPHGLGEQIRSIVENDLSELDLKGDKP